MPKFRYTGTEERVYLYPRAFEVAPGDVVEAAENPDELRFVPAADEKPSRAEKKE